MKFKEIAKLLEAEVFSTEEQLERGAVCFRF